MCARQDIYSQLSYGAQEIGFGKKPGIVVVDFQTAFTDSKFPMGGRPLVMRALENTTRILEVARRGNVPIASCYTAYKSERDMPYWKITTVVEQFRYGHPCTELDRRIYDPDYDFVVCKSGPSIFFHTPVVSYFNKEGVDTVIITGCNTSGCIRASAIDSFQYGYRTVIPEDCVGDMDQKPHRDNLRDIGRRYADISSLGEVIAYLEKVRKHNPRRGRRRETAAPTTTHAT
jgi:maleamate amidohydrolase